MVRGWNLEGVYTVQYRNVPMYSLHTIQDLIVFRTHTRSSQTSHEPGSRSDYGITRSHTRVRRHTNETEVRSVCVHVREDRRAKCSQPGSPQISSPDLPAPTTEAAGEPPRDSRRVTRRVRDASRRTQKSSCAIPQAEY